MNCLTTPARLLALTAALVITFSQAPAAADWLEFRGPFGNGVAPGADLPEAVSDKNIAWKSPLPGRGLSSPVVVGDRVFLTCSSGPGQETLHVFAFSVKDGKTLWERKFWATGRTMCHQKTCVAAPSPVSDGKRIFAFYSSNDLFCLDLDGNLLWLRGLTHDYKNASNSLGMASSLVYADNTVVAQIENDSESIAIGINADDGTNRWKHDRPKRANWTSPIVIPPTTGGGKALIGLQSSKGLVGVEALTGKEVWNFKGGASTIPSSAGKGEIIYVPSNGITAIKPTTAGPTPEEVWKVGSLRPGTASPIVMNDRIYVINSGGVLSAAKADSGDRLWKTRLEGPIGASPVGTGKTLYVVNEKGTLQSVSVDSDDEADIKITGKIELGEMIQGTPAISGNALFIRGDGFLWKIAK